MTEISKIVVLGTQGPAGTGITTTQYNSVLARLTALEAIVNPSTGAIDTGSGGLTVGGASALNGDVGLGNATADTLTFTGHIETTGSPPTIATGGALGTGGGLAASIVRGNDTTGVISLTSGASGQTTGVLCTVTFFLARANADYQVYVFPGDDDSANLTGKIDVPQATIISTAWTLRTTVAPPSGTEMNFHYLVIG